MSEPAAAPPERDGILVDLNVSDDELLHRFQARVRHEIAVHLSRGQPIYYSGLGEETGKLFMRYPDGRRIEYRFAPDGTREVIRDIGR